MTIIASPLVNSFMAIIDSPIVSPFLFGLKSDLITLSNSIFIKSSNFEIHFLWDLLSILLVIILRDSLQLPITGTSTFIFLSTSAGSISRCITFA